MRIRLFITIVMGILTSMSCLAQNDPHLKRLTEDVIQLRNIKSSDNAPYNKVVLNWSANGNPKITLMDEIKRDENNEFRGKGTNKFKVNQIVTYVYKRQNPEMVSKGDYFNSTEKDILYSAIEKNIKKKSTATYTLTGHIGNQEFVFISYNSKINFSAKVNGITAKPVEGKKGILYLTLTNIRKDSEMDISITNNSDGNESVVILNHNPQK